MSVCVRRGVASSTYAPTAVGRAREGDAVERAGRAPEAGVTPPDALDASALDPDAGRDLHAPRSAEPAEAADEPAGPGVPTPPREQVWDALVQARGNVAQAAQRLGLSRARLRRPIERWSLDVGPLREP